MKSAETQRRSLDVQCPHCRVAMRLMRQIDVAGMPNIYVFYCQRFQYVETVKEEKAGP
jgi:hypothetical protein